MTVKTLIDNAAKKVGTRYKLAKLLGVQPGLVYDWESGRRTCTPEDRARIAGFAEEDARSELILAVLEKTQGTLRGEQLSKVL